MNHPPRLSHLLTLPVLVARLSPTYADVHGLEDEYADERVELALKAGLRTRILDATWTALKASTARLGDEQLLEKVAKALADRPHRRAKPVARSPSWSAFLLLLDVEAGVAGDAARGALESPAGRAATEEGVAEVGRFLARELTK